jgi:hypothetical protein
MCLAGYEEDEQYSNVSINDFDPFETASDTFDQDLTPKASQRQFNEAEGLGVGPRVPLPTRLHPTTTDISEEAASVSKEPVTTTTPRIPTEKAEEIYQSGRYPSKDSAASTPTPHHHTVFDHGEDTPVATPAPGPKGQSLPTTTTTARETTRSPTENQLDSSLPAGVPRKEAASAHLPSPTLLPKTSAQEVAPRPSSPEFVAFVPSIPSAETALAEKETLIGVY